MVGRRLSLEQQERFNKLCNEAQRIAPMWQNAVNRAFRAERNGEDFPPTTRGITDFTGWKLYIERNPPEWWDRLNSSQQQKYIRLGPPDFESRFHQRRPSDFTPEFARRLQALQERQAEGRINRIYHAM
jgi:hypothetical protein